VKPIRAGGVLLLFLLLAAPSVSGGELPKQDGLDSGLARVAAEGRASGRVRIVVEGAAGRSAVEAAGGAVEGEYGGAVQALVPAASLGPLSEAEGVRWVRPPLLPVPQAVGGEGVAAANASAWHAAGVTGAGVRVAVIDVGFTGYAERQASGDLPASLTAIDRCSGRLASATNHGTAVAEIVHDLAPGAQLYLVCAGTEVQLGEAMRVARAEGVTVVNHSVAWFNGGRGDGSGPPSSPEAVVAEARRNGILWVNAAGNQAEQHWGGRFSDADGDGLHEFAAGDESNRVAVGAGGRVCGWLKWDDWPRSAQDLDLLLSNAESGARLADSTSPQTGTQPPAEWLCWENTTGAAVEAALTVRRNGAGGAPRLDLFSLSRLEHAVAEGSVVDPAASPDALAVGAACWQTGAVAPYSSRGPTLDGRAKPDLLGYDSVSTASFGTASGCGLLSGFRGTSASAPHVAGAAALLKQLDPLSGPSELQARLEAGAVDLGPSGKDDFSGSGRLWLPPRVPVAETLPAADVGRAGATLSATIDSAGIPTSYRFQYGPTTAYGAETPPTSARTERGKVTVTAPLSGLDAGTAYHTRVVATNAFGTSLGGDTVFATAPAAIPPPPAVSPTSAASVAVPGQASPPPPSPAAATPAPSTGESAPAPPPVLAAVAPLGVQRTGSSRADLLVGTPYPDVLRGAGGDDTLDGRDAGDLLVGGRGRDLLLAGRGDDTIEAADGARDVVRCGLGRDRVRADRADRVARDCETIDRKGVDRSSTSGRR